MIAKKSSAVHLGSMARKSLIFHTGLSVTASTVLGGALAFGQPSTLLTAIGGSAIVAGLASTIALARAVNASLQNDEGISRNASATPAMSLPVSQTDQGPVDDIAGNTHLAAITDTRRTMFGIISDMQVDGAKLHARFNDLEDLSKGAAIDAEAINGRIAKITQEIVAIASTSEELTANSEEMSRNSLRSCEVINTTSHSVSDALVKTGELVDAADQIDRFVDTIRMIASQTNLLALNATIEAARAGEAGRGFAVVAGEVKALSASVASATAEISLFVRKIKDVGHSIADRVDTIGVGIQEAVEATLTVERLVASHTKASEVMSGSLQRYSTETVQINTAINDISDVVTANHSSIASLDKLHLKMSIDTVKLVAALDELIEKVEREQAEPTEFNHKIA